MDNQEKTTTETASEPTKFETPAVSINISKSEAGDLTVITLIAEAPMTDNQLGMVLHALGDKVLKGE